MEDFLHFLQGTMEEPEVVSWFHFIALIPIIALAILIPLLFKNAEEKTYKRILLIFWVVLIVLEIFKQLIKSFHYGDPSYWEYSVRDFPFSICSMVYYFIPIILFVKRERHPKIVDAATGYLCLISLAAGIAVCVYTKMATSTLIYINIQTFIHHGSQVVLGVFVYVWNRKNITIKTVYRSLIAFAITAVIAILINVAFYPRFINMFFINPTRITNLPIGNIVQEKAGYPVYLLAFLSVTALMTFLTYFVETSIYKAVIKRSNG
ncbi:MAG: YwaF family protein [Bacilli bacterium]|nr:YwaF family protein [Bacilli bacterium]